MSEQQNSHQADKLIELFREVTSQQHDNEDATPTITERKHLIDQEYVELDILKLPPRREVHANKKIRYSFSLARPITRLLFVVILLVLIILFSFVNISDLIRSFF